MPLFKNHESKPYTLTDAQRKEFMKAIGGKFPVTVQYVPEKVRKNPKNRIPDQPSMVIIGLTRTVADGNSRAIYTYADSFDVDPVTKRNIYNPTTIEFTGSRTFNSDTDIDLLWFLWYCHPGFRGGKNNAGESHLDEIEFNLPHLKRLENVEYEEKLFEAKQLILSKTALPEADLKTAAKAFFIDGVDDMNTVDVKDALLRQLQGGTNIRQKLDRIEQFMAIANSPESLRVRSIIQSALESKLIQWEPVRRAWMKLEEGKLVEPPIIIVPADRQQNEVLYEVLSSTREGKGVADLLEVTLQAKLKKPEK